MNLYLYRLRYRIRYWLGRICSFFGFCRDCRGRLIFTRRGVGICAHCGKRY
jgi:hypothetical protein